MASNATSLEEPPSQRAPAVLHQPIISTVPNRIRVPPSLPSHGSSSSLSLASSRNPPATSNNDSSFWWSDEDDDEDEDDSLMGEDILLHSFHNCNLGMATDWEEQDDDDEAQSPNYFFSMLDTPRDLPPPIPQLQTSPSTTRTRTMQLPPHHPPQRQHMIRRRRAPHWYRSHPQHSSSTSPVPAITTAPSSHLDFSAGYSSDHSMGGNQSSTNTTSSITFRPSPKTLRLLRPRKVSWDDPNDEQQQQQHHDSNMSSASSISSVTSMGSITSRRMMSELPPLVPNTTSSSNSSSNHHNNNNMMPLLPSLGQHSFVPASWYIDTSSFSSPLPLSQRGSILQPILFMEE
jgi:hypothetical protein